MEVEKDMVCGEGGVTAAVVLPEFVDPADDKTDYDRGATCSASRVAREEDLEARDVSAMQR